jgi:type VI secretion system protein ImpE
MTSATELYKAGRLAAAVAAQIEAVKAAPADPSKRLFLFELVAFTGDLDRGRRQLDALKYDDPGQIQAQTGYRLCLDAEAARRELFAKGTRPTLLGPTPAHIELRLQAVDKLRAGDQAGAAALLAQANDTAPSVDGALNGSPFQGLRDADDLFGPVLEVFARGKYVWVSLEQVESLAASPPKYPRDLVWFPVRLTAVGGESGEVYLPTLYPGTHEHADEAVKLGRATDWKQAADGPVLGAGLKTFLLGDDATAIPDWRELVVTN